MKNIFIFTTLALVLFMTSGCETWRGVKKDTSDGAQWSKEKVNDGAKYIEKKTD
jgi:predicted small secreted protein